MSISTPTPPAAEDKVRLAVADGRALAEAVLRNHGYSAGEAETIADHVIDAALCGYEYSGLPKILNILEKSKAGRPRTPLKALHETPVSVLLDGGNTTGMLAMRQATDIAIGKAQALGVAVVGMTNSWTSGRGAYYVERIARAGLIGIHTVSSARHVAPPGGIARMLGTNPLSFGFPIDGEPLVIDLGTAAFMSTELALRERTGEPLPAGVAIDSEGRPTTDPHVARAGALLPFGGHKGFALALAVQALGVFAGSGFNADKDYGYLLLAMKPDLLLPLETFRNQLREEIERIRATPRQPGVDAIRIPSERAVELRRRHQASGIALDRTVFDALRALAPACAVAPLPAASPTNHSAPQP
ncbi:Ldh family oxidoreductase [Paracidovorax cattleyae]|uniref:Malate/lactate/ureidoglycolate dehydrogenase, LDH2 family n=1 Tax=Paracidovorax cattleyae TaxID=80868 RepID=A0A1H0WAA6_9BURK|nr:Ldh family oxidoreductase [Paracidovorax cattleyae]SDP87624.1 Malate/lactate/ureidoglycolate dehydrogenase, LDH2 family [Paracidovorax cattleyae]